MLTHDDLLPLLRATRLGRAFRSLASTTSTNTEAARWAAAGAPEGSVVLADYQTAGRGRLGRVWEAAAGQNLLFSLVLHPPLARDRLGLITLTAALAIADVLAEMVQPLRVGIKWPNDILVEERKCCGMLLESAMTVPSTNRPVVILGIGLNVNQPGFPPELSETATSLLLETGRPVSRLALLAALLNRLETVYFDLCSGHTAELRSAYEARLSGKGEVIQLRSTAAQRPIAGVLLGVDKNGALRLQTPMGEQIFHAGEVTTHLTQTAP